MYIVLVQVHFDITFKNGETHLPADEMGLPTVYVLVLIGTSLFGVFVVNLLRVQYKQVGQVHLIVLLLGGAVLLQSVSHFCELMHLVTFMTNGKGLRWRHTVFALDFAAQVRCTGRVRIKAVVVYLLYRCGCILFPSDIFTFDASIIQKH